MRVSVADTGPGIAPEHLPHVFERFWKLEKGGTRGTGLGLYISERIVRAHGGTIHVESSEKEGTLFEAVLPCESAAPLPR